ncbi:MAG: PEP-CTERM sorting domain-containing protein [Armatimonadetes bacterium]|nr:PEP-CTERM sorting domain-containing protein [Armatimonadota bacterium]
MKTLLALGLVAVAGASQAYVAYDNLYLNDAASLNNSIVASFNNGGAAAVSGINTTRLVADDLTFPVAFVGKKVTRIYWTTYNSNTTAVSARMRIRFYKNDGTATTMGTYVTGFTFAATSFAAGAANVWYFDLGANVMNLESTMWAGLTFDGSGTTTTTTQLNGLGQLIMADPVRVGSSNDVAFQSTAATGGLASGIAGTYFNFSGNPKANFGWRFEAVPEPASMAALGLGLAAVIRRRKK